MYQLHYNQHRNSKLTKQRSPEQTERLPKRPVSAPHGPTWQSLVIPPAGGLVCLKGSPECLMDCLDWTIAIGCNWWLWLSLNLSPCKAANLPNQLTASNWNRNMILNLLTLFWKLFLLPCTSHPASSVGSLSVSLNWNLAPPEPPTSLSMSWPTPGRKSSDAVSQ